MNLSSQRKEPPRKPGRFSSDLNAPRSIIVREARRQPSRTDPKFAAGRSLRHRYTSFRVFDNPRRPDRFTAGSGLSNASKSMRTLFA